MAKRPTILDKLANVLGYVKGVALTTSAVFGHREYPSAKSAEQLAAYVSWVYACVKARARDVSRIELQLYKKDRKTGENVEVEQHDVLSLLRSVNPFMTFMQLMEYTQSYKDLTGEAFWYLERAGTSGVGMITQIWLLRPDYMDIRTSADGFIAGYTYKVPGQTPIQFENDEIIHHKEFNPLNPYRGMGVVRAAAVTIDTESYAEEYNKKFFRNSAIPEVVLSTEQKLSDAQAKRMHAEWAAKYQGSQNAHKTAILEGGLEIKQFGVTQQEMEFLAGMGFSRDKILALFEVPKSRLGMTEGVTVSNADATIKIYLKYLVKPLMENIRDVLNEFLLPHYKGTEDMFFDIEDPVPEDVTGETDRLKALFAMGAITQNEVRGEQGYNEEPGLDVFYLPINLQPTGSDATREDPKKVPEKSIVTHVQTGKKGRKPKVRAPALRLRDRVAREVADKVRSAVIASIGAAMPKFAEKAEEMPASTWKPETKEAFWKQLVGKTDHYEKKYQAKLEEFFDRQEKETLARLAETEGKKAMMKFSQSDIESILISVAAENKIAAELLLPLVRQILEDSGSDTLEFITDETIAFDATSEAVKQFMRVDALKGIRVMNKVTKMKLRAKLADALQNGLSPVETARKIRDVFTEAKSVRALRVARTESLKAANRGALEAYKQSGVVAGKEWYTSVDERVCEWCGPLHGQVQGIDQDFFNEGESYVGSKGGTIRFTLESIPTPPLHPNCRCTLIPITVNARAVHNHNEKGAGGAMLPNKETSHGHTT